ncbi:MAG: GNAT family N-acetyltransferase, partial [Pseudomonadota bacterium]
RLSLETGRPDSFRAAQTLYARHGFTECPPFGDYWDDPFSLCMTRTL